jgi:DNA-binding GntR family transcriptional regulator
LEEMIVTLQLQPGSRISENWVSNRLGLGRTPVREAMQRLAREGTLEIVARAGAFVSAIDIADQLKLIEVRREIERLVVGRAARLAPAKAVDQFGALERRFRRGAETNDPDIFIPADREFNELIIETANNKYASIVMATIQAQTRRFWYINFRQFKDLRVISAAHADIAGAVAAGDEARARQCLDALIDHVEAYTLKTLGALP